jgi:hypothetical protein
MQRLTIVLDPFEAQIITEKLKSVGITAESRGVREYASIVTGRQQGRYELFVADEDLSRAQEILRDLNVHLVTETPKENDHRKPDHLKRSVAFAILGTIVVPVVFNVFSLLSLRKYWLQSPQEPRNKAIVALIILLQIPSLLIPALMLRQYFSSLG